MKFTFYALKVYFAQSVIPVFTDEETEVLLRLLTELQNFCALLAGRQFCLNRKALLYLRPCAVWLLNRTIKTYGGKPEFVKSLATASTKN